MPCIVRPMLIYLPVTLLLSVGWFLNEPVSLLSSAVLSISTLFFMLAKKDNIFVNYGNVLLFLLIVVYLTSSLVNNLNFALVAQGAYQRNSGLLFSLSILLIYSLTSSGSARSEKFIARSLTICLMISIVYGIIQKQGIDPIPWRNPYDAIQLTLGNPNFAGAFFGMLSVIPIYMMYVKENLLVKCFGLVLMCLTFLVIFGTESLQAIVVLVISLFVFAMVSLVANQSKFARYVRRFFASFGLLTFISFPVFLYSKFGPIANLREEFYNQGNVRQRLDYWRIGLEIFKDHTVIGVGPDQFQRYAGLYRTKEQVIRDGIFVIPDKAHNVLLDAFAGGGVLAGLAWLGFVIYIFIKLTKASKMSLDKIERVQLAVFGGIWSGYVFQALISPDHLVLAVIGFMSAGFIVHIGKGRARDEHNKSGLTFLLNNSNFMRVIYTLLLIFSVAIWSKAIESDIAVKRVLNNENLTRASVLEAVNQWPTPKATEQIAVAVLQADTQCNLADELAARLIEVDDRSAQGWYFKAICFNLNRDFEQALLASEKALSFDPMNPIYLVAKAKLGIAAGRKDSAMSALDAIKENYPDNLEIVPLESSISRIP